MARTLPTITAALAIVAGAAEPAESPLSAATRRRIEAAVRAARADLAASIESHGIAATARALGVSRSTLSLWRASGWLAP